MKRNIRLIISLIFLALALGVVYMYSSLFKDLAEPLTSTGFIWYFVIAFGIFILSYLIPVIVSARNSNIQNKKISTENLNEDTKFEMIYTEIRDKYSEDLAKIRKGLRPVTIVATALGVVVAGIFIWMKVAETNLEKHLEFIIENETLLKAGPVVAVLLFFVAFFFYSNKKYDYDKKYKTGVVTDIVNKANNGLTYSMKTYEVGNKVLEAYKQAAFDKHYFNRNSTEDYISGMLTDKLTVSISELDLDHKIGSGKNSHTVDVFEGLVAHASGIDEFKGTIKILNNNNKMKNKNTEGLTEVKMDSTEFENLFNVYSDNAVLTMRVLTSDIMEKMVEFERRLGVHFETFVSGKNIVMRFFTMELFEPAIFNESKEKDRVRAYYEIINLITDISKELDKTISEVEV